MATTPVITKLIINSKPNDKKTGKIYVINNQQQEIMEQYEKYQISDKQIKPLWNDINREINNPGWMLKHFDIAPLASFQQNHPITKLQLKKSMPMIINLQCKINIDPPDVVGNAQDLNALQNWDPNKINANVFLVVNPKQGVDFDHLLLLLEELKLLTVCTINL